MAVVGLVPAAGYATRLGPIGTSKEMIELAGRPLVDYLLEKLEAASCTEIRVVTRPQKADVAAFARSRGASVVVAEPETVARSLWLGLAGLADDDVVCFGFPDCLWEPLEGFRTLVEAVEAGEEIALGLFRTNEPQSYDPIVLKDPLSLGGRIADVEVKPRRPSSNLTWGCAAARVRALRGLEHERDPGEYFAARCRDGVVVGRWLSDIWIDLGVPARLAAAQRAGGVPPEAIFVPAS